MTTIAEFALAHDPDPAHSRKVLQLSRALFDALIPLHELDARARCLLEAAATLHDVGYARDPDTHHKQSRDMILESGIAGFTPRELAIIACTARYHRKSLPDPRHKTYRDLDPLSRQFVGRLAAMLRIADGLDRSHTGSARSIRVTQSADAVSIHVRQEPPCPADIEAAIKKADLFQHAFGVRVRILPG